MEENQATRKGSPPIKVYCLPGEREIIEKNAQQAGLSVSSFLREIGQGYVVSGIADHQAVRELVRVNGDLGRLGGLLKLWLSNDERTQMFDGTVMLDVLERIKNTQNEMSKIMKSCLKMRESEE